MRPERVNATRAPSRMVSAQDSFNDQIFIDGFRRMNNSDVSGKNKEGLANAKKFQFNFSKCIVFFFWSLCEMGVELNLMNLLAFTATQLCTSLLVFSFNTCTRSRII